MGESFADRWGRKWTACGFEDIGTEFVPCGEAVLPTEAAPCLSFDHAASPTPVWEIIGPAAAWNTAEWDHLAAYQVIGFDGAGNPLCVEQESGTVWLLDHEDRFRTRQFVNGSVGQLAECLLAYMGEQRAERFSSAVRAIDPAAISPRSFWWYESAQLN